MGAGPFLPPPPLKLQESSPFSFFLSDGVVVAGFEEEVAAEDVKPRVKPVEDSDGLAVVEADYWRPPREKPEEESAGLAEGAVDDGPLREKPKDESAGLV